MNNRKKLLYLHIGARKTGTSALQHFFTNNRDVLAKNGIAYPQSPGIAHHRLAQSLLAESDTPQWFPRDLNDCDKEWETTLQQIDTGAVILSSEIFFRCKPKHISKIKKLTKDYEVKIIAYLRRQNGMVQSEYNQVVKSAANETGQWTFDAFVNKQRDNKKFNYCLKIDIWAAVFGKENIIIRPYETQQFHKGNIFSDFLHYSCGASLSEEYSLPKKNPNIRLHRVALEYKRLANCLPLSLQQRRSMIDPLREVSGKLNDNKRVDFGILSPLDQHALIQECSDFNSAIAQEYLGRKDGRLFYDPLPDLTEHWEPYEELLEDDARYINECLAESWQDTHNMIAIAVEEVSKSANDNARKAAQLLLPGITAGKSI